MYKIQGWKHCILSSKNMLGQGWTNLGRRVVVENKFCVVAPNLFGASAWNLLNISILAPAILRRLLDIWKRFSPLCYNHINYCYKSFCLKEMNVNECLPHSSTMSKKIGPTPTAQSAVLYYYYYYYHHHHYCEIIVKYPCRHVQFNCISSLIQSQTCEICCLL